jgi:hypothetical protein
MKFKTALISIVFTLTLLPFSSVHAQTGPGCYVTSPESGTVSYRGPIPTNGATCASLYPGSSPQQGPTGTGGIDVPNNLPYTPLEPIPGQPTDSKANFCSLLNTLFTILIYLGGMLAVLFLVLGGITYMVSEVVDKRSAARERIKAALWGLLLLLMSWIILNTINPQLVGACKMVTPTQTGVYYPPAIPSSNATVESYSRQCRDMNSNNIPSTIPAGGSVPVGCRIVPSCGNVLRGLGACCDVLLAPTADSPGVTCGRAI